MIINLPLRDVKYSIAQFDVHGASYRKNGNDPVLITDGVDKVRILENVAVFADAFRIKNRRLNNIEAYGGMEDLLKLAFPVGTGAFHPGRLIFPPNQGLTELPLIIPVAKIEPVSAFVSLADTTGKVAPAVTKVVADSETAELFLDWEMSSSAHKLIFDTPAFHIGLRANWKEVEQGATIRSGAQCVLTSADYNRFIGGLQRITLLDSEFIRVALTRAKDDLEGQFLDCARQRYAEMNGSAVFGHSFESIEPTIIAIGKHISKHNSILRFYGISK